VNLYHYTCRDAAPLIERDGLLKPHPQPILDGMPLVWLTDMEWPDRAALGLTSHTLNCDRTDYRVQVSETEYWNCVRWTRYARLLPPWTRRQLEFADGALPAHWWIASQPIAISAVKRLSGVTP